MNTQKTVWDPFLKQFHPESVAQRSAKIKKKLDTYNQKPHLPIRNLILCAVPGVVVLGAMVIGFTLFVDLLSIPPDLYIFVVFLTFAPVLFYYGYIHNLERDLIKQLVAQKNNWTYNPSESRERWMIATRKFPHFFNRGNQGQNLQDEFWGKFEGQNFYQSIFRYQRKSGHGKNRRVQTFHKTIIAIELPKQINNEFRLEPPPLIKWSFFGGRKQAISTESHEFNKYYQVLYNGKADAAALNIIRTLSPALIEKLIHLKQSEGETSVYFKDRVVIFMFNGRLLKKMKTNFFKKVELDPRDQESIEKRLESILKISQEMLKYLD